MKQQAYESLLDQMIFAWDDEDDEAMADLIAKATILRKGNRPESVIRELVNR